MSEAGPVSAHVLLVEDDVALGGALVALLAEAGHEVRWAKSLAEARGANPATAELILLDLGLPDGDGLNLCRELRAAGADAVVVVLTAKSDETAAVRALDGGADDFVTKPFRPAELVARLRAHLRRRPDSDDELRIGLLRIQPARRLVWLGDAAVSLRPKEFELLQALASRAGTVVRRELLIDEVWDEHWSGSTKTLDVHIAALRRKLADAGDRWERIETVRGYGYRFDDSV
ncbi:MAG: response regulator transcription factor [Frankiaceae bacterium]|nr:response regulator transcription factor [Frankiaceae bacterium]